MPGEAASTDGVEHARRQLESLGIEKLAIEKLAIEKVGVPCRTVGVPPTTIKAATIQSATVRVESRSIVVRARRSRSNDVPAHLSSKRSHERELGALPGAAERRRAVLGADSPATPSAPIPRPNGKKQPSA